MSCGSCLHGRENRTHLDTARAPGDGIQILYFISLFLKMIAWGLSIICLVDKSLLSHIGQAVITDHVKSLWQHKNDEGFDGCLCDGGRCTVCLHIEEFLNRYPGIFNLIFPVLNEVKGEGIHRHCRTIAGPRTTLPGQVFLLSNPQYERIGRAVSAPQDHHTMSEHGSSRSEWEGEAEQTPVISPEEGKKEPEGKAKESGRTRPTSSLLPTPPTK